MAFTRKENGDTSIPYGSFVGKSIFIHGSAKDKDWRTRFLAEFGTSDILVIDPWKTAWTDYIDSYAQTMQDLDNISGSAIITGTPGVGTGIIGGYSPITLPNFNNIPFFWENTNCTLCDFQYFEFDDGSQIPSHTILLLGAAMKKDKTKVIVNIPNTSWRFNIGLFLKELPRENYFGQEANAFTRIKQLMGI